MKALYQQCFTFVSYYYYYYYYCYYCYYCYYYYFSGGNAPSYVYRLIGELYDTDDNDL